jgi:hypothetical protein
MQQIQEMGIEADGLSKVASELQRISLKEILDKFEMQKKLAQESFIKSLKEKEASYKK